MDWTDRVAVVTGAASGIGAGLALHAARLGMRVIAADVDRRGLDDVAARAAALSGSVQVEPTDVTDPEAVETLASRAFEARGSVCLLFNNAGVLVNGKSWERSLRDWRVSLDVNVMGVVHGIRSFVPRMLAQGEPGRVVNTSSIGGLVGGGPFMGPYQLTKHAVVALSETLYAELLLEEAPVDASVLCPADVATAIFESDRLRPEAERTPLRSGIERSFHETLAYNVSRGITPEELAGRAFEGIEAGKFWLLPQPAFKPMVEARMRAILDETNPAEMREMLSFSTR